MPLALFSILFGLSMDYHVFLLSRIREEYDKTGDNAEAVAYGLRYRWHHHRSGDHHGRGVRRVRCGSVTSLEQMGFGLAVAVHGRHDRAVGPRALDHAPARDRNWYLPGWLRWLPKVDVEGHAAAADDSVLVPDTPAELVEAEAKE